MNSGGDGSEGALRRRNQRRASEVPVESLVVMDRELREIARLVVDRVLSVYRLDYIERCVKTEPESLLALVKRLDDYLVEFEKRSVSNHDDVQDAAQGER
jgi:hypothetical protein